MSLFFFVLLLFSFILFTEKSHTCLKLEQVWNSIRNCQQHFHFWVNYPFNIDWNVPLSVPQDVDHSNVTNEGQQKIFLRQHCSFIPLLWSQGAPPPHMTATLECTCCLEAFDVQYMTVNTDPVQLIIRLFKSKGDMMEGKAAGGPGMS